MRVSTDATAPSVAPHTKCDASERAQKDSESATFCAGRPLISEAVGCIQRYCAGSVNATVTAAPARSPKASPPESRDMLGMRVL